VPLGLRVVAPGQGVVVFMVIAMWGGFSGTGIVHVVCVYSDVGGLGAPLSAQDIVYC
jgi:hypothetical protein